MIHARDFVDAAGRRGFNVYAGVPCSFLTPFINYVIGADGLRYLSAANEGDAVAMAAGAWLGGRRGIAMMQNSGLGNAVSPLTSLTHTFGIPVLVICTHRGAPGVSDEPQHALMGTITEQLFETMGIPWATFPRDAAAIDGMLERVDAHMRDHSQPFALIMQKGSCEPFALATAAMPAPRPASAVEGSGHQRAVNRRATRTQALEQVLAASDDRRSVVIATTGFSGRELYALADRPQHFYMVGSMGCASSLGLGLALARPDLRVLVVDGDGAALMRMGNLATLGAYNAPNLVHLLLDNEAHDSTGAQATVSACTDFATIAAACGYARVMRSDDLDELARFLAVRQTDGSAFMHMKIATGARDDLPRPAITPPEVRARLMQHIGSAP
ncbi:MAG: phosphonopyruvate decarboxylase [Proteobacteria bacterium]|nr:phosphonopyruvate decarboxylase [Pseudomonadota bacterium]